MKIYTAVPYDCLDKHGMTKSTFEQCQKLINSYWIDTQIRFVILRSESGKTEICSFYPFSKEISLSEENKERCISLIEDFEDALGKEDKKLEALQQLTNFAHSLFL